MAIAKVGVKKKRLTGVVLVVLVACGSVGLRAQAQTLPLRTDSGGHPLILNQTHYQLHAGERVQIAAPLESLEFLRNAKSRTLTIGGAQGKGLVVGPNVKGDQVPLAASLTIKPGDYTIKVSAVSGQGEERAATIDATVDALTAVPLTAAGPPVVLLDGWQLSLTSSCPMSTDSSGNFSTLEATLSQEGIPVYFFENCSECPNCSIEELANVYLAPFLDSLQYTNGLSVPQIDLIAHSMGGLIARAYLAGLQSNGLPAPPLNPRVRKLIEIATPNFGAFVASDLSFFAEGGTQSSEMIPGSLFLWSLGTWNQLSDDLRGVDALAIIGNAGSCCSFLSPAWSNASDGVVSITSASLGFASLAYARDPSRTRIVPYCHTDAIPLPNCSGPPIAKVDEAPKTGAIILSFLADTSEWQSIGSPNQTQYGGAYFAFENAAGTQYTAFNSVTFNSASTFQSGELSTVYYDEFASGSGTFDAVGTAGQRSTCGPFSVTGGYYSIFRCKFSPWIFSVAPFLTNASGLVVKSGGVITINGVGFGQQCSGCQVVVYPGPVVLQVSSWSDAAIAALLPSAFNGIAEVVVQAAAGSDSITFMASPPPPTILLSSTLLHFTYTVGAVSPAAQTITVANSGGGTLTWSPASSVSWLTLSSAPDLLTVSVNASGLSPNIYTGTITITAAGASNSPQTVSVTLTVTAPPPVAPSISLSTSQVNFTYMIGGAVPSPQSISVSNSGGGTLTWSATSSASWITVSSASNTLTISVNPANLSPGPYTGTISVTAAGASNSPQTITVNLTIAAAPSSVVVNAVVNAANSASGTIAPGEMVTIFGSGLGPVTGVGFSLDPATGMVDTTLAGTRVLFGEFAAPITYTSANQVNAIVPYEIAAQSSILMQVQYQGSESAGTKLQIASAAPGAFTFNSSGTGQVAAANQDGSYNGPMNPAPRGSYVTIYFTGGGQTDPPGVTGSISGPTLKWFTQSIAVTVGGVLATVTFDGAAPTLVDGVGQLNIQLANNTPSGSTQPVVITVGDISSPSTATLAVQ